MSTRPIRRSTRRAPVTRRPVSLYTDQRIARVGDIVTVNISINDKATFGNSSGRSQTAAKTNFAFDWLFNPMSTATGATAPTPLTFNSDVNSTSSSQGTGNIDRSEQIQFSVPASRHGGVANGNLVISGLQEVRVNFELRQLTVAGVVRPSDISPQQHGRLRPGRRGAHFLWRAGRLSEVQQPGWGQQIYDNCETLLGRSEALMPRCPQTRRRTRPRAATSQGSPLKKTLVELLIVSLIGCGRRRAAFLAQPSSRLRLPAAEKPTAARQGSRLRRGPQHPGSAAGRRQPRPRRPTPGSGWRPRSFSTRRRCRIPKSSPPRSRLTSWPICVPSRVDRNSGSDRIGESQTGPH